VWRGTVDSTQGKKEYLTECWVLYAACIELVYYPSAHRLKLPIPSNFSPCRGGGLDVIFEEGEHAHEAGDYVPQIG